MASPSLLRASARPGYVCAQCAFRASQSSQKSSKRWLGTKYLAKVADAEMKWQEQVLQIKGGKKKSMLAILEERGLVLDTTVKREVVDAMMTDNRVGAYVGVDPTGPSLHIGHMLPLMSLFWMYVHGYHAVTLVGGATGKIGDPTDRLQTRAEIHRTLRTQNMVNIHFQLKKLWLNVEAYGMKYGYRWEWAWKRALLNNNSWMNKLPLMELLQVLGPGVRMGSMLAKDTVKNKMTKGDGMSFAEFTYPLLQAWDWWHMYNALGVRMQIGGSDQMGNIKAGVDAVRYIARTHPAPDLPKKTTAEPFGFTTPLLTTSSGAKFGKSAGNAVWLDKDLTSSFELYAYLLRTSDKDVSKYLKLFTFMPIAEIDALVTEHMENPSQRKAQHKLASEFLELVHGAEEAKVTAEQHRILFQNPEAKFTEPGQDLVGETALNLPQVTLNTRPSAQIKLPRSFVETKSIGRLLFACGLASSAAEGHRLATQQALFIGGGAAGKKEAMNPAAINWVRVKTWKPEHNKKFLIDDNMLLLRRGKHNIRVISVVEDDVYEASMARFPGDGKGDVSGLTKNKTLASTHQVEGMEIGSGSQQDEETAGLVQQPAELEPDTLHEYHPAQTGAESLPHEPNTGSDENIYSSRGAQDNDEEVERDETPEQRLARLRRNFNSELKEHHAKKDAKYEPKGKFMGHGKPKGPVETLPHAKFLE